MNAKQRRLPQIFKTSALLVLFLGIGRVEADPLIDRCMIAGSKQQPNHQELEVCIDAAAAQWIPNGERAKALMYLSAALIKLKSWKAAVSAAKKALTYRPNWYQGYERLAIANYRLGNYQSSFAAADSAVKFNDRSVYGYFYGTLALSALGNYSHALAFAEKLNQLSSTITNQSLLALAQFLAGDFKSSVEQADKILQVDSNRLFALQAKAGSLINLGQKESAYRTIEKLLSVNPKVILSWGFAGYVYNLGGDFDKSVKYINRIVENDPKFFDTNRPYLFKTLKDVLAASKEGKRWSIPGASTQLGNDTADLETTPKSTGLHKNDEEKSVNGTPLQISYNKVDEKPDDIAVIVGNSNYEKQSKDIPNVTPAYADAESFRRWVTEAKGVREGNIILLRDGTSAQMESVFGNDRSHKGQLFNWTKPGISNVYIYYAGHGAPAGDDSSAYLVPSDTNSATVQLTGYPLATLYKNLKKLPAKSITVVLEACFSGASQNGNVISRTSGLNVLPKLPNAPSNITVISAGRADQVASWTQDSSHSLFTKYFLTGMSGEADKSPYGNGDGDVSYPELGKYLDGTMTYFARRYYGRDQNAQIVVGVQ